MSGGIECRKSGSGTNNEYRHQKISRGAVNITQDIHWAVWHAMPCRCCSDILSGIVVHTLYLLHGVSGFSDGLVEESSSGMLSTSVSDYTWNCLDFEFPNCS